MRVCMRERKREREREKERKRDISTMLKAVDKHASYTNKGPCTCALAMPTVGIYKHNSKYTYIATTQN